MCNIEQSVSKLVWNKWTSRCELRMMNVSAELCSLACLFLTVGLTLGLGPNQHMDFTFLLPAGSTECFYQTTAMNDSMEVDYQVNKNKNLSVFLSCLCLSGTVTV